MNLPDLGLDANMISTLSTDYASRREELITLARFAEAAERFEDMCQLMKAIVLLDDHASKFLSEDPSLTVEERNLLSVSYKNVISARRASWRTLHSSLEDDVFALPIIEAYSVQLEAELEAISNDVLTLLIDYLIPKSQNRPKEYCVFYLKMAGDYYRYLAEFMDESRGYHEKACSYYQQALDLADSGLDIPGDSQARVPTTHPIRLGLALNFSVCYFEILNQKDKAVELAHKTFEDALEDLDFLSEQAYKDSILILQLLKDNLTLWKDPEN